MRYWTLTGKLDRYAGLMVDTRRQTAERALTALDRTLKKSPFLVDERCTIADIAVYAYSHLSEDAGCGLADYPAFRAWLDRVARVIGPGYPAHPYSIDPHAG